MTNVRLSLTLAGLLVLAGCGKVQQLHPRDGHMLPPKPATAPAPATAQQLLTPTPSDKPGRSDELLTKSATRPDDKFDLPPH